MNAEQRGGMALNKDFSSKTGNGREGRAIATPTGEQHRQIPSLPLALSPPLSIFIYSLLFFYFLLQAATTFYHTAAHIPDALIQRQCEYYGPFLFPLHFPFLFLA